VTEGVHVQAGDLLLVLDTPDEENRRTELEAELREATAQVDLKKVQLERITKLPLPKEFWHARTELAEAEEKARAAAVERQRYQELFEAKLASEVEYDQRKLNEQLSITARDKARANIAVLERGLEQDILKEAAADLTAASAKVERLKTDLAVCEQKIEHHRLRAPVDGQVTLLRKHRPGEAVTKGEELIHLSGGPVNRARLYVGETMIHRIRTGQVVRLRSGSFDTLRYGYVDASVEEVALEPQTANRYLVKVRVEKTPVPLTLGSTVEGDIILRRSPIWRLLVPARD
jgi:multidrug resistance efflux pump